MLIIERKKYLDLLTEFSPSRIKSEQDLIKNRILD
jgi:hypothetical protein